MRLRELPPASNTIGTSFQPAVRSRPPQNSAPAQVGRTTAIPLVEDSPAKKAAGLERIRPDQVTIKERAIDRTAATSLVWFRGEDLSQGIPAY